MTRYDSVQAKKQAILLWYVSVQRRGTPENALVEITDMQKKAITMGFFTEKWQQLSAILCREIACQESQASKNGKISQS